MNQSKIDYHRLSDSRAWSPRCLWNAAWNT